MTILCLDSTWDRLMLGLLPALDSSTLSVRWLEADLGPRPHATALVPAIRDLLAANALTPKQLTGVALNTGPGSFTGIRTAVTVARTMGQFLPGVALYGFSTFVLLAADTSVRGEAVTVMLNAYRQRHYTARLTVSHDGAIIWHTRASIVENELATSSIAEAGPILLDSSLVNKVEIPETRCRLLEAANWFTPEAMAFLLSHGGVAPVQWQALEARYMQLPNISTPKPKASSPS